MAAASTMLDRIIREEVARANAEQAGPPLDLLTRIIREEMARTGASPGPLADPLTRIIQEEMGRPGAQSQRPGLAGLQPIWARPRVSDMAPTVPAMQDPRLSGGIPDAASAAWKGIGSGVARGVGGGYALGRSALGVVDPLFDPFGTSPPGTLEQIAGGVADRSMQSAERIRAQMPARASEFATPEWFAATLGETLPTTLLGLGTMVATGGMGAPAGLSIAAGVLPTLAVEGGDVAHSTYQTLRSRGVDEGSAAARSLAAGIMVGGLNAGLEIAPLMELIGKGPLGGAIKKAVGDGILRRIGGVAAAEAITEPLQGSVSEVGESATTGDPIPPGFLGRRGQEAVAGGAIGGLLGGATGLLLPGESVEPAGSAPAIAGLDTRQGTRGSQQSTQPQTPQLPESGRSKSARTETAPRASTPTSPAQRATTGPPLSGSDPLVDLATAAPSASASVVSPAEAIPALSQPVEGFPAPGSEISGVPRGTLAESAVIGDSTAAAAPAVPSEPSVAAAEPPAATSTGSQVQSPPGVTAATRPTAVPDAQTGTETSQQDTAAELNEIAQTVTALVERVESGQTLSSEETELVEAARELLEAETVPAASAPGAQVSTPPPVQIPVLPAPKSRQRYTSLDPEMSGREWFSFSPRDIRLRKGETFRYKGRRRRYWPSELLNQFVRVPNTAKSLIEAVSARTKEVVRIKGRSETLLPVDALNDLREQGFPVDDLMKEARRLDTEARAKRRKKAEETFAKKVDAERERIEREGSLPPPTAPDDIGSLDTLRAKLVEVAETTKKMTGDQAGFIFDTVFRPFIRLRAVASGVTDEEIAGEMFGGFMAGKWLDGLETGATKDYFDGVEHVVFSAMMEGQGRNAQGAAVRLSDGASLIVLFETADVSTLLHEFFHAAEVWLDPKAQAVFDSYLRQTIGAAGFESGGSRSKRGRELLARAFERYWRDGDAPNSAIREVFETIKQWMIAVYRAVSGTPIDVRISDEVRAEFDRMIGQERGGAAAASAGTHRDLLGEPTTEAVTGRQRGLFAGEGRGGSTFDLTGPDAVQPTVLDDKDQEIMFQSSRQTETEAFKRWFGNSKVVDAEGKPLVVYHGTQAQIGAFDPARQAKRDHGWYAKGFYFTPDASLASRYASSSLDPEQDLGASVIPVYLSLKNPYLWPPYKRAHLTKEESVEFTNRLIQDGYDGVIVREFNATGRFHEIIAFRPEQIKSAIGNRGTFDPNDPSILMQHPGDKPGDLRDPNAVREMLERALAEPPGRQTIGTPELANPARSTAARRLVDALDQLRKARGEPGTRPRSVMQTEAQRRVAADFNGERARLEKMEDNGQIPTELDVHIGKEVVDRMTAAAVAKREGGHEELVSALAESFLFHCAYRRGGTELARALGARVDPNETPAQRARRFVANILHAANPAIETRIDNLTERAADSSLTDQERTRATKARDALVKKEAEKQANFLHAAKDAGIDVPRILAAQTITDMRGQTDIRTGPNDAPIKIQGGVPVRDGPASPIQGASGMQRAIGEGDAYKGSEGPVRGASGMQQAFGQDQTYQGSENVQGASGSQMALDIQWLNGQLVALMRIRSMLDATIPNMVREYWINAILTGPQTQIANIAGNAAYGAWEALATRFIAATANLGLRQSDLPTFGEFGAMFKAFMPALRQAGRNFLAAYRHEMPILETEINLFREGQLKSRVASDPKFSDTVSGRFAPSIPGIPGRGIRFAGTTSLLAFDEFFKTMRAQLEVHALALRQGKAKGLKGDALAQFVTTETSDLASETWRQAIEEAKRSAFQQDVPDMVRSLAKIREASRIGFFFVPFINTPFNILRAATEKTPLVTIPAFYRASRAAAVKLGWDNTSGWTYQPGQKARDIANMTVAWSLFAALYAFAWGDDDDPRPLITGSSAWEPGERELQYRAAPPLSVRIGDRWISYSRIEPFATTLGSVMDALFAIKAADTKPDQFVSAMSQGLGSIVRQIEDKTFMQGVSQIMDIIDAARTGKFEDTQRAVGRWATDFAASWVPNIARQPLRESDTMLREQRVFASEPSTFWNRMQARIAYKALPWAGVNPKTPPPKVDLWGREIRNESVPIEGADVLYRMLVPVDVRSAGNVNAVDMAILRWNRENPDQKAAPRPPDPYVIRSIGGRRYRLDMTDSEYHDFARDSGRMALERALRIRGLDKPTEKTLEAIDKAVSDSRASVRARMFPDRLVRERGTPIK